MASLFKTEIKKLKGVGPKTEKCLNNLGVNTIGDIINFYPRSYENWATQKTLEEALGEKNSCVKLRVFSDVESVRCKGGKYLYKLKAMDKIGVPVDLVFFNNKYTPYSLKRDTEYIFKGNVERKDFGGLQIISPKVKSLDSELGLCPIYHQTNGITSAKISTLIKNAMGLLPDKIPETIPKSFLEEYNLCSFDFAIRNIHFPKNYRELKLSKNRIIFEEFLVYQISMELIKSNARKSTNVRVGKDYSEEFQKLLPFELTSAQKKSILQCISDMKSGFSMNRLLQGDVGSGKTAVAASLCYTLVKNGYQASIMAPTEILALQHYNTFLKFFSGTDIKIGVLHGSMKQKEKRQTLLDISDGNVDIVVGTHSIISDNVNFKNLGLIITDEQHRFGVKQRETFVLKGDNPHVLVMSATPIPRTLAMILYGDLDISVLDEPLPGRQIIDTFHIGENKRERAWKFIQKIINEGGQAYVVCASIEENENDIIDVTSYRDKMINWGFKPDEVEILHGKMRSFDKTEIMNRFLEGETKVLVSTTVIEVGIDVPNACLILIENAERFGISQLHQLRGRVGRGNKKSYCILVSDSKSKDSKYRFDAMTCSNDGFYLSEEDLKLRGPGDFFGVNQHGIPNIGIQTSYEDINLMSNAQECARKIIELDPKLENPSFKYIKRKINNIFKNRETSESKDIIF